LKAESLEHQTELRKLLHSKINGMMRRRLTKFLIFGDKWIMCKKAFAGNDYFSGAGKAFATMRLEGCHIFLQEIQSMHFPVMMSFVTKKKNECWGFTGNAHCLTHNGVYSSKVASMGAKYLQPHSILCKGNVGCNMSLTFHLGSLRCRDGRVEPLVCFKW
jgi:hypothetical protein